MVMDTQCLFDRSDFGTKKEIVDVNYMGAMNPTAGSFSVADRLQRHFSVFSVQTPKEAEALSIYRQIVVGHLQISGFQNEVAQMGASVVAATIDLQNSVRDKFRPSTSKFMFMSAPTSMSTST